MHYFSKRGYTNTPTLQHSQPPSLSKPKPIQNQSSPRYPKPTVSLTTTEKRNENVQRQQRCRGCGPDLGNPANMINQRQCNRYAKRVKKKSETQNWPGPKYPIQKSPTNQERHTTQKPTAKHSSKTAHYPTSETQNNHQTNTATSNARHSHSHSPDSPPHHRP